MKSYWTRVLTYLSDLLGADSANKAAARQALGAFASSGGTITGPTTFGARASSQKVSIPYAASLTIDASTGNVFEVGALKGNVTSMTISNAAAGQFISIRFVQDATGGRYVTPPGGAKVAGGVGTSANQASWLNLVYTGSRFEGQWLNCPL